MLIDGPTEAQPMDMNMRRINMKAGPQESNDTLGLSLEERVHMTDDLHGQAN